MALLIKNARVFAPTDLGVQDVLMVAEQVVAIGHDLPATLPDTEVIDAKGQIMTPGFFDQHIHVTGGGGEGGPVTRTPEIMLSELVACGTTSVVGVSGTDYVTRSIPNLLAKVRALKTEGVSAWMYTSNYAFPPTTMSASVADDMFLVPECLGVKIALGDHRSSFPTTQEVLALLAEIRVAGMISGKIGFLHIHTGNIPGSFDMYKDIVAQGFPIKHIRPTHVARHPEVFRRACEFAKKGGFIDITTGGGNYMGSAADAVRAALADGVPFDRITLSSDGHGSMPRFNEAGEMVGLGIGSIMCDIETIRELKDELGVEKALTPMTKTVAGALGLETKGGIAVGKDADLLFLTKDFEPEWVFMMGKVAMRQGEVVLKGAFEE